MNRRPLTAMVALALLVGCQPRPSETPAPPDAHGHEGESGVALAESARRSAGIRTEPVTWRIVQATREVPGVTEVAPDRATKVTPSAPGKIDALFVRPGDTVRAGQRLATLDSFEVAQAHAAVEQAESGVAQAAAALQTAQAEVRQAQAAVQVADATIEQAEARVESARQALARQRELASAGAFSQAPVQSAQSELSEAQSDLLKAQTELQSHLAALQRAERLFQAEVISRAELEQAQLERRQDEANVDRARRRVEIVRLTLEREQRIAAAGLLNAREVQTAEAGFRDAASEARKVRRERDQSLAGLHRAERGVGAARTSLAGAQAALRAARTSLYALEGPDHAPGQGGRVVVTAPLGGIVAERGVTQGEAVERTTVLFTLQNQREVQVIAQVPEAQIDGVRIGQRGIVAVDAFPKERFIGVVQSVGSQVDERTRALPVRLAVDNPDGRLKPRMFARVALSVGGARRTLAAPESALVEVDGKTCVFVDAGGNFERRPVTVGAKADGVAAIVAGVRAGERVVVDGAFVLKSEANRAALAGHED